MNIRETVKSLPALPVVYAANMLTAQGYRPSDADREAIAARQEFFRSLDLPAEVNIEVRDNRTGTVIGHLTFS